MTQQPRQPGSSNGQDLQTGNEFQPVRRVPQPGSPVRVHQVGQVVVLSVADLSGDVVDVVIDAAAVALADGPRGVVLMLRMAAGVDAGPAARVQAEAAVHVRDWAGVPVVVACQDPHVRRALWADPSSRHVPVTSTVPGALAAVLRAPSPSLVSLSLAPHLTAPRAARNFVTTALLEWGLARRIPMAVLVVSELVTNAMMHAGTRIRLGVATQDGRVRITVRDGAPGLTPAEPATPGLRRGRPGRLEGGYGLSIVGAVSGGWGVLPTTDGGKVVWAVLNDPSHQEGSGLRTGVA